MINVAQAQNLSGDDGLYLGTPDGGYITPHGGLLLPGGPHDRLGNDGLYLGTPNGGYITPHGGLLLPDPEDEE